MALEVEMAIVHRCMRINALLSRLENRVLFRECEGLKFYVEICTHVEQALSQVSEQPNPHPPTGRTEISARDRYRSCLEAALVGLHEATLHPANKTVAMSLGLLNLVLDSLHKEFDLLIVWYLRVLLSLSESEECRHALALQASRVVDMLFKWIEFTDPLLQGDISVQAPAAAIFCNLLTEKKFQNHVKSCDPPAHTYLLPLLSSQHPDTVEKSISALSNLTTHAEIRDSVVSAICGPQQRHVINTLVEKMNSTYVNLWASGGMEVHEMLERVLALLVNMTLHELAQQALYESGIVAALSPLIIDHRLNSTVRSRIFALLSRVCKYMPARQAVLDQGLIPHLCECLARSDQSGAVREHVVRCLVLCGEIPQTLEAIVSFSHGAHSQEEKSSRVTGVSLLIQCLSDENQQTAGNAALCLSKLVIPRLASSLKPAIGPLVELMKSARQLPIQKNAAVCLARLAKLNSTFLEQIRELRGIEIMIQLSSQLLPS
eukprot:TRINITY_DN6355_c0_g1_i2.p1 TRINITY_DN6355_c0_g1~~TRINITY_DN6355_c0_g1_i2.p1  ORF type:complete len:490 (+),score=81.02 TRINITY_DN6355_c0_g1_i2:266-1735(+)